MLAARDALSDAQRAQASHTITRLLLDHPRYRSAAVVAAYCSFGSEFDTAAFIVGALSAGKRLLLPRIDAVSRALRFFQVANPDTDLVAGVWGIREPDPARCTPSDPLAPDFVLVPGLAFSPACERLGYGGGFYDGVLAQLPARSFKAGAAFSVQLAQRLPLDSWDRRVDAVLTEREQFGVLD